MYDTYCTAPIGPYCKYCKSLVFKFNDFYSSNIIMSDISEILSTFYNEWKDTLDSNECIYVTGLYKGAKQYENNDPICYNTYELQIGLTRNQSNMYKVENKSTVIITMLDDFGTDIKESKTNAHHIIQSIILDSKLINLFTDSHIRLLLDFMGDESV